MILKTFEDLRNDVIAQVSNLDTQEGSYVDTIIRAVLMELADAYQDLQSLVSLFFVDETSGEYLVQRADEFGLVPKEGIRAKATVTFSGVNGRVINAGTAVQTASGLIFTTDEDAAIANGEATVPVTAAETGSEYNVPADVIIAPLNNIGAAVASSTAATGGIDDESDESLSLRLHDHWRRPETSGNAYQYEKWAMEVDGIGGVRVRERWAGPGTVGVVVLDGNMQPPSGALVQAVAEHIERQRPVGPGVTVMPAKRLQLDVQATVRLDSGVALVSVQEELQKRLTTYCRELAFQGRTIVRSRIAYLLLGIDGVADVLALTMNGRSENLELEADTVPTVGSVVLECAE